MADAPAPSPYAPGIISDERSPPRPPTRAVTFLLATFVTATLASGLWQLWAASGSGSRVRSDGLDVVPLLRNLPGLPILLWAYLSDRVPVWGTRRDGYVALATVTMGAAWLVVAAAPGPLAWVAVAAPFGLATAFARPAILGALAEIGRRRAATGRLAAAHVSLAQLAELVLLPATLPMALTSLWLPAGVAAGLALAVVVLIVALSSGEMPAPGMPPPAVVGIPRFLRSRAFWTSTAVLACAGLATVPQTLLWPQLRAADGGPIGSWALRWTMPASTGAGALVYLVTCRRLPFAGLLRVALLVKAGTLAVQALTATNLAAGTVDLVLHARAVADGLAAAAVLDLVLRAAPRGREAFGSILLLGVSGVLTALVASLATSLSAVTALSLGGMAWFATCAASAGAIAVWLLPASIVELRESRRGHRERRMIGSPP